MYLEILLVSAAGLVWWLRTIYQEGNRPVTPQLHFKEGSQFTKDILDKVTILKTKYVTPLLWGRSGQWQTLAYGILGNRRSNRWRAQGTRETLLCGDGATISFDVFEPLVKHQSGRDLTFLICPGIANSCESVYIRSFVQNAQNCGFRSFVLNHLGVVASVKLTSARLFSYGGTAEFAAMADHVWKEHPDTLTVALGFSMGGNVVTCWLGESEEHQKKVLCGISVCQGYDIIRSRPLLLQWNQLRRGYMFSMARNMKRIMARNREILFSQEVMKKYPEIDIDKVFRATTLLEIDEFYTRILRGYASVEEMYETESSCHKLREIHIPILFVNSLDDPIVPEELLDCVKDYATTHEKALCVITRHGGHLGFFEGNSYLIPESVSWLCRLVVQYSEAVLSSSHYFHEDAILSESNVRRLSKSRHTGDGDYLHTNGATPAAAKKFFTASDSVAD